MPFSTALSCVKCGALIGVALADKGVPKVACQSCVNTTAEQLKLSPLDSEEKWDKVSAALQGK